jgi:hypothetical protein
VSLIVTYSDFEYEKMYLVSSKCTFLWNHGLDSGCVSLVRPQLPPWRRRINHHRNSWKSPLTSLHKTDNFWAGQLSYPLVHHIHLLSIWVSKSIHTTIGCHGNQGVSKAGYWNRYIPEKTALSQPNAPNVKTYLQLWYIHELTMVAMTTIFSSYGY